MKIISKLLLLFLFASGTCAAQSDVLAHNVTTQVTLDNIDRSTLPVSNYVIYNQDISGYDDTSYVHDYGRSGYTCRSATNSMSGACPTSLSWGYGGGETPVTLRFTEIKSHITVDLILKGSRSPMYMGAGPCGLYTGPWALNKAIMMSCSGITATSGSALNLNLPQTELKKLPTGGVWTAQLLLDYRRWDPNSIFSTYTVNFRINLTDNANIQVYMPKFASTKVPQIDLNIRPKNGADGRISGNQGYSGSNTVDMCLYDGFSTNSSSMQITFSGMTDGGDGSDTFNLHKNDDPTTKLPYKVNFGFSGQQPGKSIINGQIWSINQVQQLPTNWNRITAVGIPGIAIPVLCWPAKLTISTDLPSTQPAGQYTGTLKMVFTPSTTAM